MDLSVKKDFINEETFPKISYLSFLCRNQLCHFLSKAFDISKVTVFSHRYGDKLHPVVRPLTRGLEILKTVQSRLNCCCFPVHPDLEVRLEPVQSQRCGNSEP